MTEDESKGEVSFEAELQNLERVVSLLERGDLDLEEAIRKYESGCESLKKCYQVLDLARKRIEVLAGSMAPCSTHGTGPDAGASPGGSRLNWRPLEPPGPPPEGPEAPGESKASN